MMRYFAVFLMFALIHAAVAEDSESRRAELENALRNFDKTSLKDLSAMPRYRADARRLSRLISRNDSLINWCKRKISEARREIENAKKHPPLRTRRKCSERIGYYYIDDPNKTFIPISIPRDRHRNVKWVYPSWRDSNPKTREAEAKMDSAWKRMRELLSDNDGLRRQYENLRRRCRSAMRKELAGLTSPVPAAVDGKTSSPTFPASTEWDSTPFKDSPAAPQGTASSTGNIESKLKKKLVGKTPSEVLKLCGKPSSHMVVGEIDAWTYAKHHRDPITGQFSDLTVLFRKGRVTQLSFFARSFLPPFKKLK